MIDRAEFALSYPESNPEPSVRDYYYCFSANRWVSFDDERSITVKSDYAFDQGLAGVMTWSIDTDDFMGMCNGAKFPLLR